MKQVEAKKTKKVREKYPVKLVLFVEGTKLVGSSYERRCSDKFFAKEDSEKFLQEMRQTKSWFSGLELEVKVEEL